MAARVPNTTASVEAVTATSKDKRAACRSCLLWMSSVYHSVEKPPHTFTRGEALKE